MIFVSYQAYFYMMPSVIALNKSGVCAYVTPNEINKGVEMTIMRNKVVCRID